MTNVRGTSYLSCPKCGGMLIRKTSYTSEDRVIYRVRECRNCGYLHRSIERPAESMYSFEYELSNLRRLYRRKRMEEFPIKDTKSMDLETRNKEIVELRKKGIKAADIAAMYQLSVNTIFRIIREEKEKIGSVE